LRLILLDGEHDLTPPTFYALVLMDEYGVTLGSDDLKPSSISGMLAAMLTDSEDFVDGHPARKWTPDEAAKLIDPARAEDVITALTALLLEAFPEPKGKADEGRPTSKPTG
jgi:hypothetical protein